MENHVKRGLTLFIYENNIIVPNFIRAVNPLLNDVLLEKKDTKIWFPEEYITSEVPFPVLDNKKLSLLLPPSYISKKALPLSN